MKILSSYCLTFFATLLLPLLSLPAFGDCEDRGFNSYEQRVMGAYLAYYGRPADPGGLAYWAGRLEQENGDLNSIMNAFANSEEFERRFGSLDNTALVNNIFLQLFGRDADAGGLAFFVDSLNSGERSLQTIAINVLDGAQNDDATIIDNRLRLSSGYVSLAEETNFAGSEAELAEMVESVSASSSSLLGACSTLAASVQTYVDENSIEIAGHVIDPVINDARVCLDMNGNLVCEDDEPSTTTDDLGAFAFQVTETPPATAKVIITNSGSFTEPAFGYHNGIPFDLQLFAPVAGEDILVTPLSTLMSAYNVTPDGMAEILNQWSGQLGATLSGTDMTRNPLELTSGVLVNSLSEVDLRVIRANIIAYATQKVLVEMQKLEGFADFESSFIQAAQNPDHAVFQTLDLMVTQVNSVVDFSMLDPVFALMNQGNSQLAGVGLQPLPELNSELIVNIAVPFVDYLTDIGVATAREQLANLQPTDFDSDFKLVIAAVEEDVTNELLSLELVSMGTRMYGAINRSALLAYPTAPIDVQSIVLSAAPELSEGVECTEGGFIIVEGETLCTSAIPKQISLKYEDYFGDATGENTDPVAEQAWDNMPLGTVAYDREESNSCSVRGTVVGSDGLPLEGVPLYFGHDHGEAYVTTDAQGRFAVTNIPADLEHKYLFGAIVGPRRGVYPEYMGNADYFFFCTGSEELSLGMQLQRISPGTTITGRLAEGLRLDNDGWRLEIHAVPGNTAGTGIDGGGYINDYVSPQQGHPYTSYDASTGEFSVTELAGGTYMLAYALEGSSFDEFQTAGFIVSSGETVYVLVNEDGSIEVSK